MHSFSSNFQHDFTIYFATHLAHSLWPTPQKRNIFPKHFLYLRPISQMGKKISHSFERTDHLTHTLWPIQKKLYRKIYYAYPKKPFFQTKQFFPLASKSQFSNQPKFLIITRKNNFSKQKISYLCAKKLKCFISNVFWVRLCYFSFVNSIIFPFFIMFFPILN